MVTEEEQTSMELASESVPVPQVINSNEPRGDEMGTPKKKPRLRKKALHAAIRKQMEFYFGDANLSKDRFLGNLIKLDPYIDLEIFLRFNKIRALTTDINQIVRALKKSEILAISEDGSKVCRVTPISQKENIEECTIYVQRLPLNADHEWLSNVFAQYGPVSYVSIPRYKSNKRMKGFAFVEFEEPSSAAKCLEGFREKNCVLPSQTSPETLLSIKTFHEEEMMDKEGGVQTQTGNEIARLDLEENCKKKNAEISETMEIESDLVEGKSGKKRKHVAPEVLESDERDSETDSGSKTEKRSKKSKRKNGEGEINKSKNTHVRKTMEKEEDADTKVCKDSNLMDKKEETSEDKFEEREETAEFAKEETSDSSRESILDKDKKSKRKISKSLSGTKQVEVSETIEEEKGVETIGEDENKEAPNNDEVFVEGDRKKKRKRKRHNRAEKLDTADIGMQVMAKKDWKVLRNKYLELQRSKMKSLKSHLKRTKWNHWNNYEKFKESEKVKTVKEEIKENTDERNSEKSTQRFVFTPGVIVKVEMDEPCSDPKNFKAEFKRNSNIKYVDIAEGASEAFVRCNTSEAANALVAQSNEERSISVLRDEEETEYWNKMSKDREDKLGKKLRVKQRGRDKLLKKAEKELGKHIKFDEV